MFFFSVFFTFDMPIIPQNLRERVICMLNAGIRMNAVAMNIGRSTFAIRHLRQHFQTTGRTEDQPRSGRRRVDHDAWPRPLYSEHPPEQTLPNGHSYCC